jgi:hypothetical protein
VSADFARLYAHLGLQADCSLEEFKQACRRRIRAQHPDLARETPAPDASQIPLVELLPLYVSALRFHRHHGRLPGAAPTPATGAPLAARATAGTGPMMGAMGAGAMIPPASRMATARLATAAHATDTPRPRRSLRGPLLALLAGGIILAAIGGTSQRDDADQADPHAGEAPATTAADAGTDPGALAFENSRERLALGMDANTVRAIQGDPLQWNGTMWVYGPSWLRFDDDGVLVDWYSSPLHPLRTATSSPPQDVHADIESEP